MENAKSKKTARVLSPDGIRQAIGYLGIIMPAILMVGTLSIGKCTELQDSISHYYYTIMGNVLVMTLCSFSVFLFLYQGYERWDNIVTTFAGLCALGIALFATTQISDIDCAVCFMSYCKARVWTHYISAALFFTTLSYISFCLFTKSKGPKTKRKKIRNKIYRTCAVVMLLSIIAILLIKIIPSLGKSLAEYKPVFWLEWIALAAFGVSWLVKGKAMLADSKK